MRRGQGPAVEGDACRTRDHHVRVAHPGARVRVVSEDAANTTQQVEYEMQLMAKPDAMTVATLLGQGFELFPCIVLRRPKVKPKVLTATAADLRQAEKVMPPPQGKA